jgi:pyruvate ferredoxin oxidoreductase beta subunit
MKIKREHYKTHRDLPHQEYLTPGSAMCAGCGGLATLRLFHKVLGEKVVVVNAAGCMTLLAAYPFTPLKSSWLYTTMSSASAGAQGIRDALDVLAAKRRLRPEDDLQVLVLAGDGSSYDMGLSATSGAIYRGLDFWYLCYDNESYGNTGFQTSSGSPLGSLTGTSPTGTRQIKKDLFALWCAQHPPYVATVSAHEPVDLAEKIERAAQRRGPKLFLSLAVCPTGWGFHPQQSDKIAWLAIATGVWPLKEAIDGKVRHTLLPDRLRPVEEYLQLQRRFRLLFEPRRQDEILRQIQANVDAYWNAARSEQDSQSDAGPPAASPGQPKESPS